MRTRRWFDCESDRDLQRRTAGIEHLNGRSGTPRPQSRMVGVMRNLVMSFAIACVMTGLFTAMLWAQVSSVTFMVTP